MGCGDGRGSHHTRPSPYLWLEARVDLCRVCQRNPAARCDGIACLGGDRPTRHADPGTEGFTIIAVAAAGVVVNGVTAALFMSGGSTDLNIRGAFLHMVADALVSLGVVAAGALYLWTGWTWLDPVTSLAIALVVVVGTWGLFEPSRCI